MLRSGTAHAIGMTLTTLNLIYIQCVHAFLSSHLYYCNALFFGLPNGQLDRLLKVQNAPLEWFFRLRNLIISRPHLSTYNTITSTSPVMFRVVFKVLLFVYKSLHNQSPPYIKDLFPWNQLLINNALRSPLFVPTVNCSTLGDRTFAQAAPVRD